MLKEGISCATNLVGKTESQRSHGTLLLASQVSSFVAPNIPAVRQHFVCSSSYTLKHCKNDMPGRAVRRSALSRHSSCREGNTSRVCRSAFQSKKALPNRWERFAETAASLWSLRAGARNEPMTSVSSKSDQSLRRDRTVQAGFFPNPLASFSIFTSDTFLTPALDPAVIRPV
jgi:hypothetical protein